MVGVGVAELELFIGEFAVDVEDGLFGGNFFGQLGGEDGFAGVGYGEEDDVLVFDDEASTEEAWVGAREGFLNSLIGPIDGEGANLDGQGLGLPTFGSQGLDGVESFHVLMGFSGFRRV